MPSGRPTQFGSVAVLPKRLAILWNMTDPIILGQIGLELSQNYFDIRHY